MLEFRQFAGRFQPVWQALSIRAGVGPKLKTARAAARKESRPASLAVLSCVAELATLNEGGDLCVKFLYGSSELGVPKR
jgi:hypothetical protein